MGEPDELPPWHGRVRTLCAVLTLIGVLALIAKVNLGGAAACTIERKASLLFFVCMKYWALWLVFLAGALGWGTLTYTASRPHTSPESEDNLLIVSPPTPSTETVSEAPKLEFPTNRRAKNIDIKCAEVIDAMETFTPKPRERHGEFPDQTYDYLKIKLPKKYWIIGQYKRKGNRGPHLTVDREIGVDLIDITENNLKALHKRLEGMRVEYKKIILILWDHGKVSGGRVDEASKEYMNAIPELKGVAVIRV